MLSSLLMYYNWCVMHAWAQHTVSCVAVSAPDSSSALTIASSPFIEAT